MASPHPPSPAFPVHPETLPKDGNPEKAALGLDRWVTAARDTGDQGLSRDVEDLIATADIGALLRATFANSPFLTALAAHDPQYTRDLLVTGPDLAFSGIMETLATLRGDAIPESEADMARNLRELKRRAALTAGLADIAGAWDLGHLTRQLSAFADGAIGAAAAFLLRETAKKGAFRLADETTPERQSGLIILGVGKLGGRELNYSSDVDLIVLYDPDSIDTDDADGLQHQMVRLTQSLIRLLADRTADGYVFRTDLRIRPDPGSTPIAMSTLAAETYYESLGQNWERAALIKARVVAGDEEAGSRFLDMLRPFIWRRNLDFAAIQDIHSIKRQIHSHKGGAKIAVKGHNLKLGRGGIREIEFFAQTQQLIWGGRVPELRLSETIKTIEALEGFGQVSEEAAHDMGAAYDFLRRAEHRLQMTNDEQTHSLPDTDDGLLMIAHFMGYDTVEAFTEVLLGHLRNVETHYAALFEDAPSLGTGDTTEDGGNLVFTGGDVDPDTIRTLTNMGFKNPERVDAQVRGWHHGRYRAMRSTRAREILTELMPTILQALGKTADPDTAFTRFDEFLSKLPAGIQLFSLFHSRPNLLELVAEVMGSAPRLAERLARRPQILDGVLGRDFFNPLPDRDILIRELNDALAQSQTGTPEEALDISRRWAKERKFQVGAQILLGSCSIRVASHGLSDIAESLLVCLQPRMEADFTRRHGTFDGADQAKGIVTVAMGKLGSGELQPASDLDIIFVYDTPEGVETSNGDKPLVPSQYYARLSQRIINAITAQTAEGRLYELDMRLRPSGAAGPIASNLIAFDQYHEKESWTWEHMALTRARPISGPDALQDVAQDRIKAILTRPRDAGELLADVADMRARIERERHYDYVWEMKYQRGTIVDVEFIAQYLQLKHAHKHPDILAPSTRQALENARDLGLENADAMNDLVEGLDLWLGLQAVLRLAISGRFEADKEHMVSQGLMQTMCRVAGVPNKAALEDKIRTYTARIYDIYRELIEDPARDVTEKP